MEPYCGDCQHLDKAPGCFKPLFKRYKTDYCSLFKLHKEYPFKIDRTQPYITYGRRDLRVK